MENKTNELIESIGKTVGDTSKEVKELKAEAANSKKEADEFKAEVKKLNETIASKDGTIKDIQDAVFELKTKQGKIATGNGQKFTKKELMAGAIVSAYEKNLDNIEAGNKSKISLDLKAQGTTMTTANLASGNYIDFLSATPGMRPIGQTRFRELCSTIPSQFDTVEYPVQNTPAATGSFDYQTSEASTKQELSYGYTMNSLTLKAFAGFAEVSRQSLRNIPFMNAWLPINLMEDMQDREDLIFSAALYAAATGSTTITSTTVDAEQLVYYYTNLLSKKFTPSAVAIDPAKWATILLTKPSNYSLPNVVTIDVNGTTRILGKPLVPVNWLSSGKFIMGDWSKVAIIESEGLSLRSTDSNNGNFTQNVLTFMLERTQGLGLFRADAFIATTLA